MGFEVGQKYKTEVSRFGRYKEVVVSKVTDKNVTLSDGTRYPLKVDDMGEYFLYRFSERDAARVYSANKVGGGGGSVRVPLYGTSPKVD